VAGLVLIDHETKSNLIERSSREGLELNGAFRRLRRLVTDLLAEAIEPRRTKFREDVGLNRRQANPFPEAFKTAAFEALKDAVAELPEPIRLRATAKLEAESSRLTQLLSDIEAEQAKLSAQAILGRIVGEVLHEGRAPVAFIGTEAARLTKWFPTLCEQDAEAVSRRERIPRILRGLETSSDRLTNLFRALEPLSGTRRGKVERFSCVQIVTDTVHLFRHRLESEGISVLPITAPPDLPDVVGYRSDLATALANVIDNSIHWLSRQQVSQRQIKIEIQRHGESVVIDVSDSGPGVPEEFADRVFDVGFTLKAAGTGLGLSIAREALGRSGGSIELLAAHHSLGGACFRISVPLYSGPAS
jgi:signal transduction histidine kinase